MNRSDLRFHFLRNALYHTARRRVLEGFARYTTFAVLLLGTAAAADIFAGTWVTPPILGAFVAAVAAAQFAFDFAGRARSHEFLQRRYYEALAEIEGKPDMDAELCAHFTGRLALLAADEPPTYRALDASAHNEALDAIYGADAASQRLVVPAWQRWTQNIWHYNGENYPSRDEVSQIAR